MLELFRRPTSRCSTTFLSCSRAAAIALLTMSTPIRSAPGDEMYLHAGQLVAADGSQLNIYCTGNGSPTVLFDSGHQDWAPAWAVVQPEVGNGRAPAALTVPATASALRARCHGPANGFLPRFTMRSVPLVSAVPTSSWVMRSVPRTCAPLLIFTRTRSRGLVLIDPDPIDAGTPDQIATAHGVYIRQAMEIQRCRDDTRCPYAATAGTRVRQALFSRLSRARHGRCGKCRPRKRRQHQVRPFRYCERGARTDSRSTSCGSDNTEDRSARCRCG